MLPRRAGLEARTQSENGVEISSTQTIETLIHRAPWVLPGAGDAIADGAVALGDDGTVRAVGTFDEVRSTVGAPVREHRAVLAPGLVNAHAELGHAALKGRLPGGAGLAAWLTALREALRALDPDEPESALGAAMDELRKSGTAVVASPAVGPFGTLADVGSSRGLTVRELASPHDEPSLAVSTRAALAPSAWEPRARPLSELARRGPLHLRLFADPAERALTRDGAGPLAALAPASPLRGGTLLEALASEGLDLDARRPHPLVLLSLADARREELDRLSSAGVSAVFLPRETLHLRTALPPLLEALAAGLCPALGTGSPAASPSLDVLAEAAALRARFPTVPARALFAMCTAWGADALGLPLHGRLEPGARPGLLAFALPPSQSTVSDPFAHVLASPVSSRVWACAPTALDL